ncbi:MAG: glycosyltransferase [Bacteroidales bacterium]|nr:glycosyltransferase [Bacteroidales bacterium]
MSTYNGEKYLNQQIESILNQKDVDLTLYVRDDGSTDNTVSIIDEFCSKSSNIVFIKGSNIGYAMSFMWLVYYCTSNESNYYAFSDQDDIWEETKLISAINLLNEKSDLSKPALYYSDLKVVDKNEEFIRMANDWEGKIDKFMILTFIGIRGCTMVYNQSLQNILTSYKVSKIPGHDTFVALVAFWTGCVVYDHKAYILYRQTGQNVSITGTSKLDKFKKNLRYVYKRITVKSNERQIMANELLNYAAYIDNIEDVKKVAVYKNSFQSTLKLLVDKKYFKHTLSINFTNRILMLLQKF